MRTLLPASLLGLVTLCACSDLSEFKTSSREVFRGEIAGSDSDPGAASFIRQGFDSHTVVELTFDPERAAIAVGPDAGVRAGMGPGAITAYTCDPPAMRCGEAGRSETILATTPLLPIEGLAHDALSEYTFPGGGRLRNYIFGARFGARAATESLSRYAMVFVSLMDSGGIEARIVAPSVDSAGLPALFGVFVLRRQPL